MNCDKIFNNQAELQVLGDIFLENDLICQVFDFLDADDFYNARHKIIYKAMKALYEKNVPMDITTLSEKLGQQLEAVGGITYLSQIVGTCIPSPNIKAYAEIIKEKSDTRKLITALNKGLVAATDKETQSSKVIENVLHQLLKIKSSTIEDCGQLEAPVTELLENLETRYKNGGEIQGIKCGYKTLDRLLGGFNPQDFIILAGRPSMGKTAFALNMALNTALKSKGKIAFFNLEMGKQQLLERAISILSEIPMENIKNGSLKDEHWVQVGEISNELVCSSFMVYDKLLTLNSIEMECRKLKIRGEVDVVIIDYLQLINNEERSENRNQDISKISRSLKLLAKELDITVVALSQLSRATESRCDHKPMLSDLRESGAIEQDADIVMLLYRDEYYNAETEKPNSIECIVAKQRNGQVGTVRLKWKAECQKII